ncbi:hypothetical protein ACFQ1R_05625 [Mariniflexile jejuense]|uniref:Glycosyl transferase family 2 n=1 Tax=Mariniflexile jejuense TaxID=1173582 RepID=A0ABW3JH57_9FLAO
MQLAPVVLFVYNRPWHTIETLNALKNNCLSNKSLLYIYCDGAKQNANKQTLLDIKEVRAIVKREQWCGEVVIVERDENWGLAQNILDGISNVIKNYGKIIVLEDDMVTSKNFLDYMNFSLAYYKDAKDVYHINGHNFKSKLQYLLDDYYFSRYMNCWGWATWKDRWEQLITDYSFCYNKLLENKDLMRNFNYDNSLDFHNQLLLNINKKINTWAILWYSTIFFNKGYCLTSKHSYVSNIGLDGTGENCFDTTLNDSFKKDKKKFSGKIKLEETKLSRMHIILSVCSREPYGELKFVYRKIKKYFVK